MDNFREIVWSEKLKPEQVLFTNTDSGSVNKTENSEDLSKIDPAKAAITGSIHFPNFGTDPSDTVRGEQALRAIKNTLEAGYGVIANVSGITNVDYRSKLESLKSAGRLILLDEMAKPDEDAHSYGVSRRQLLEESKKQGFEYVMSGELEKEDLLEAENIQKFLQLLNTEKEGQRVGMVVMNRKGIMEKSRNLLLNNASGLPEAQYYGEFSQNQYIWNNWKDAGFDVPEKPLDLLNGTRFAANDEISVKVDGYDYGVSPTDIMQLRYKYQNEGEIGFPYKVDHYSAAIYHSPTMWIALAGENGIASAEIDYQHPEEQTRVEEMAGNREVFEKKRLEQKRAIVLQNFDLCCNIVKWKEEGAWPTIVMEAIKNKTALPLTHYDIREWQLSDGKLLTKERLA